MTFIEQFNAIKKKAVKLDTTNLPNDLAMQVNLTDEDCGGTFYIANIDGIFAVEPYDYRDHTVMLTLSAKDLLNVLAGKLDAVKAVTEGKIQLEGNADHALALVSIAAKKPAKKAAKKPAAKKPAAKKAAAKKPAAKKTAAKKPAAKKPATKKPAATKPAATVAPVVKTEAPKAEAPKAAEKAPKKK